MDDKEITLRLTDCGCDKHHSCLLFFSGQQAIVMESLLHSLPKYQDKYTYICEYGKTHCLIFDGCKGAGQLLGSRQVNRYSG